MHKERSVQGQINQKITYMLRPCYDKIYIYLNFEQEGPEGPGTLTRDGRFLRVPFFHCFMYNKQHLGDLNLKAIVLKFKSNVCKRIV